MSVPQYMVGGMKAERIARWSEAVGAKEAAKRLGVHIDTLGRYASGAAKPPSALLVNIRALVEAWEQQAASADAESEEA